MLHYRYLISIILILCVNHQLTAMGFLYGDNSYLRNFRQFQSTISHVNTFSQKVYQNRIPIAATAAATVLLTSYDKPVVMYGTMSLYGIYLLRRCILAEDKIDRLISLQEQEAKENGKNIKQIQEDIGQVKGDVASVATEVQKLHSKVGANAWKQETGDLKKLVLTVQKNVSEVKGSFDALREEFGVLKNDFEPLPRKITALSQLVTTEANTTREHNTQNANRILALLPQTPKENPHQSSMRSPRLGILSGYWTERLKSTSLNGSNQSSEAK